MAREGGEKLTATVFTGGNGREKNLKKVGLLRIEEKYTSTEPIFLTGQLRGMPDKHRGCLLVSLMCLKDCLPALANVNTELLTQSAANGGEAKMPPALMFMQSDVAAVLDGCSRSHQRALRELLLDNPASHGNNYIFFNVKFCYGFDPRIRLI